LPDLNLDEKTGAVQSANMVDGWTVGMLIWKKTSGACTSASHHSE
jgi:hypothetical protein